MAGAKTKRGKNEMNTEANVPEGSPAFTRYGRPPVYDPNPPIMGNPAVVGPAMEGDEMREFMSVNQGIEDVADYSSKYQANPDMDKESKEYVQSRNYSTGGDVKVRGGGKAIRGMNFTGVK
jgi:hypothetical protein